MAIDVCQNLPIYLVILQLYLFFFLLCVLSPLQRKFYFLDYDRDHFIRLWYHCRGRSFLYTKWTHMHFSMGKSRLSPTLPSCFYIFVIHASRVGLRIFNLAPDLLWHPNSLPSTSYPVFILIIHLRKCSSLQLFEHLKLNCAPPLTFFW